MKLHHIFVIVLISLIAGCGSNGKTAVTPPATTSEALLTSQDAAVLEVVLTDVLTFDGENSPRDTRYGDKDHILVAPQPCSYKITLDRVLLQRTKASWEALSSEQLASAQAAAKDLVRRFDAKENFEPLISNDPRIEIQADPPTTQPGLRMDRPICAWAPGYSGGGSFAVVRLSIPWSIHHADGVYLLEKHEGAWKIALRDFTYYF